MQTQIQTQAQTHLFTARAAVAQGPLGDASWLSRASGAPRPAGRTALAPRPRVLWAKRALQTREGRCVALRSDGATVWVGVADSPSVRWVRADKLLSAAQAARWQAEGF
jgi:hypothetical protein